VGNGNIGVGNTGAPRKSGQQMAGAMSQQGAPIMGDNQCSPQKFVQLVGCRDPKARDLQLGTRESERAPKLAPTIR
jgi:hypothetical protein